MNKLIGHCKSVGLAIAAALLFAGAAGAQTAPVAVGGPPTAEALTLAGRIAQAWAEAAQTFGFADLLTKAPKLDDPKMVKLLGDRGPLLYRSAREATLETWTEAKPHVEAILTHAMAERFSLEELRSGAAFVEGPDAAYALEVFRFETAKAGEQKALSKPAAAALARLEATEAGRKFLSDSTDKDGLLKQCQPDLIGAIVPPWLLRFSDKLDAAEMARGGQLASDAYAPSAENQALGVSVVHSFYGLFDDSMWDKAMPIATAVMAKKMAERPDMKMPRPEWNGYIIASVFESLRNDKPTVELAFGRALARLYDHEDLKALAEFTNGPGMAYLKRSSVARKPGEAPPAKSPEEQAALSALGKHDLTAKALGQIVNFASTDPEKKERLAALFIDMGVTLGPKIARRFAIKAETLEAKTRADRGW